MMQNAVNESFWDAHGVEIGACANFDPKTFFGGVANQMAGFFRWGPLVTPVHGYPWGDYRVHDRHDGGLAFASAAAAYPYSRHAVALQSCGPKN